MSCALASRLSLASRLLRKAARTGITANICACEIVMQVHHGFCGEPREKRISACEIFARKSRDSLRLFLLLGCALESRLSLALSRSISHAQIYALSLSHTHTAQILSYDRERLAHLNCGSSSYLKS